MSQEELIDEDVDWRYKSIEVAKSERDISGEPYNY
jgi:hypothetical protein